MSETNAQALVRSKWVDIDYELGEQWGDEMPFIVILNEGFDGLRLAVWADSEYEVADVVAEEATTVVAQRFQECDGPHGCGFHHRDRAQEWRPEAALPKEVK